MERTKDYWGDHHECDIWWDTDALLDMDRVDIPSLLGHAMEIELPFPMPCYAPDTSPSTLDTRYAQLLTDYEIRDNIAWKRDADVTPQEAMEKLAEMWMEAVQLGISLKMDRCNPKWINMTGTVRRSEPECEIPSYMTPYGRSSIPGIYEWVSAPMEKFWKLEAAIHALGGMFYDAPDLPSFEGALMGEIALFCADQSSDIDIDIDKEIKATAGTFMREAVENIISAMELDSVILDPEEDFYSARFIQQHG
jgi:hypothetical protein